MVRVVLVYPPPVPGRRPPKCIRTVQNPGFMQAPRPRMYKPPAGVDNLRYIVDNAAELFVEVCLCEELTRGPGAARQAVAAAGPAVTLIRPAACSPVQPLAWTAAAGYYTYIMIAL